ncbi:MAG TPA: aminotransferase class V-fold PLP-dependent enzyme, partial [Salinimicrobium sp.]|nr:aminotransferase class V-fold PLP-dependent enzyme [Salinimicrobium sp.]
LGASAYKWLNAGYGNGFLLFRKEFLENYLSKKGNFREDFELGHLDTFNFGSLLHAIRFIEQIGTENIENDIKNLSFQAKERLAERNLLENSVVNRKQHSSIFNIKGDNALFEYLRSKNVICARRGNGIRVSFHVFNTLEDLEILMKALKT